MVRARLALRHDTRPERLWLVPDTAGRGETPRWVGPAKPALHGPRRARVHEAGRGVTRPSRISRARSSKQLRLARLPQGTAPR